jgi:hypothetical protein
MPASGENRVNPAPANWDELVQRLQVFSSRIRQARQQPVPEINWYPFDTL